MSATNQLPLHPSPLGRSARSNSSSFVVRAGVMVTGLFLACGVAQATVVTWDVDPSASYVRLTVPDQVVNVTNIGDITVRMRDAGSTTQWTDGGGRRAFVDGTVVTDYADATSITFLGGTHNLVALEQVSLRPNPADWSAATTNYVGTSTALAAFGARVRGTYTILTFDIAFIALRNVRFDLASGVVPLVGGSFAGNQTRFGIAAARADVDGLELPLGLGQPVPDLLDEQMSPVVNTNGLAGTIQNLGGRNRKLTYPLSVPIAIQVDQTILTGQADGEIVAYGVVPEPPTLRIARDGQQAVVIAWPATATGFVLEQNFALGTTNWISVTNVPVVVGGDKQVTLSISPGGAFYRLRGQ